MEYIIQIYLLDVVQNMINTSYMRDKRAKFVELANKRVTKCIRDLKLVGNLSNRSAYDFSEDDARKIVRALQKEVEAIRGRFADGGGSSNLDFSL